MNRKSFYGKTAILILAVAALLFALCACGGGGGAEENAESPPAGADGATGDGAETAPEDGGVQLADYDRRGTAATDGSTPTSEGAPLSPEPVIVPVPAGTEGKTWDLKADEQGMEGIAMLKNERDAFEHIKVRTNGQVDITMYGSSTLLPFESKFSGVAQGLADLSVYMCDINEGTQPINAVMNTILSSESATTLEMSKIYRKFVRENPIFEEENASKGVAWITNWALAPTGIHITRGDARVPADMKGRKVLCTTTQAEYIESMGAAALVVGVGDYYPSLEKNLADTILAHWPIMHEFKLTELTPGHIMLSETNDYAGLGNLMQGWLVNKAVWDSIPPEYQQVIREELDWSADATSYDNDKQIKVAIEFAEGIVGHTINRLTPEEAQQWYDLAIVNRDTWVKTSGLPTEEATALWDKFQSAVKNRDL